jgi:hypothetical protein
MLDLVLAADLQTSTHLKNNDEFNSVLVQNCCVCSELRPFETECGTEQLVRALLATQL